MCLYICVCLRVCVCVFVFIVFHLNIPNMNVRIVFLAQYPFNLSAVRIHCDHPTFVSTLLSSKAYLSLHCVHSWHATGRTLRTSATAQSRRRYALNWYGRLAIIFKTSTPFVTENNKILPQISIICWWLMEKRGTYLCCRPLQLPFWVGKRF